MKNVGIVALLAITVFLTIFCLAGCSVNPSGVTHEYAKKFASKITYVQDIRTGLCFGVLASRKTGDTDQTGLGLTVVPCDAVKDYLAK